MPSQAPRPCAHPGCPALVRGKGRRFCDEHLRRQRQNEDSWRGSAAKRGYDAEWREFRERYLQDNPACDECGASATVVAHRLHRSDGGSDDIDNLRPLCSTCHNRETMRRLAHARRGRVGLKGEREAA